MSKFAPQIDEEVASSGDTHRFDFAYTDIPAGIPVATSQVFLLPKVGIGDEVVELTIDLIKPFTGPGITTVTLDIGDDVSPTAYATAVAIGSAPITVQHIADKNNVYTTGPHQLQIRLNPAAAQSLSSITAGQFYIAWNIQRWKANPKEKVPPFGQGYT